MAISKDNVVFVYRNNDMGSSTVAGHYSDKHGLSPLQLIGIDCSDTEILPNYATFLSEVEDPIKNAVHGLPFENTWVIILGYNVPGGFYDGIDIISSTSRIARMDHTYVKGENNPLYDRKIFQRFGSTELGKAYVTSRIDGPTVAFAKNIINNGYAAYNQKYCGGKLFLDPYTDIYIHANYSDPYGTGENYRDELLNFEEIAADVLNINICSTSLTDPYLDTTISKLIHDGFYWGSIISDGSNTFFEETDSQRLFFYNVDIDSAFSVRTISNQYWCYLALNNDYAACAGSMSEASYSGLLRPKPFFDSLIRGGTVGESFLYSCPQLNWTIAFFGDPLVTTQFPFKGTVPFVRGIPTSDVDTYPQSYTTVVEYDRPSGFPNYSYEDDVNHGLPGNSGVIDEGLSGNQWQRVADYTGEALARASESSTDLEIAYNAIASSGDVATAVDLLYKMGILNKRFNNKYRSATFSNLCRGVMLYGTQKFAHEYQTQTSTRIADMNFSLTDALDSWNVMMSTLIMEAVAPSIDILTRNEQDNFYTARQARDDGELDIGELKYRQPLIAETKTTLSSRDFYTIGNKYSSLSMSPVLLESEYSDLIGIDRINTSGVWDFIFYLQEEVYDFVDYHFRLQVSETSDFSSILYTLNSSEDTSNWYYEKLPEQYAVIPDDGVDTRFVGRRIKYRETIHTLTTGVLYYFRISQIIGDTVYSARTFSKVINA